MFRLCWIRYGLHSQKVPLGCAVVKTDVSGRLFAHGVLPGLRRYRGKGRSLMPPVYLCVSVNGQVIRYLHSTPETQSEAEALAIELNRGMRACAYMALGEDE